MLKSEFLSGEKTVQQLTVSVHEQLIRVISDEAWNVFRLFKQSRSAYALQHLRRVRGQQSLHRFSFTSHKFFTFVAICAARQTNQC